MSEFERYVRRARGYHDQHPGQREGQAAFNQLHRERPDLTKEIRGGDMDPFDDDTKVPALLEWLAPRMTAPVYLESDAR